jgi:hypothetical protein
MNLKSKIFIASLLLFSSGVILGQDSTSIKKNISNKGKEHHKNFVDANGDGYNDNAPDHDGDGIPNGIDPDYIKLKKRKNTKSLNYIDSNGDGINDNLQLRGRYRGTGRHFKRANQSLVPQDTRGNRGRGAGVGGGRHGEGSKGNGKGKGNG